MGINFVLRVIAQRSMRYLRLYRQNHQGAISLDTYPGTLIFDAMIVGVEMAVREIAATGIEAIDLVTSLLQRARRAHPTAGIWEAADMQWSWRLPRESDDIAKTFWVDDDGPVAGIWVMSSPNGWQIDPIILTSDCGISAEFIWERTLNIIQEHPGVDFILPVADDDSVMKTFALETGFDVSDKDFTGWIDGASIPDVTTLADGFSIVNRSERDGTPHPMSDRNGEHIAERLRQCSIYDPTLDLAIESSSGEIAGYSLYWFDPVTRVGLVEPVRVHDAFQRKGLARAMVTHGLNLLVKAGAERVKVSWETEAAGALYLGTGFTQQSTTIWYSSPNRNQPADK